MEKEIVVLAHPSSKGEARRLAEEYMTAAREAGKEITLIDLYKEDIWNRFLSFEDPAEVGQDPEIKKVQNSIKGSDRLVLFFPVWWYEAPAIMKNFFDSVFTRGFAFEGVNEKARPLMTGHDVVMFMTSGGPEFIYNFGLFPLKKAWNYRFKYCGIKPRMFIFGGYPKRTPTQRSSDAEQVRRIAKT